MKRFIIKIVLIAVAILTPLYIADIIMTRNFRSRDYYPFTTWNDIIEGRLNSDMWVLGSSRAWVQYNPRVFDSILNVKSYNLGCNAEMLRPELQCCEIALSYNPTPKYILLDLFCNSLTMELTPRCKYIYIPYIYKNKVRRIIRNNENITIPYLFFPTYRFTECRGGEILFTEPITNPIKGYNPKDATWDGSYMHGIDTIKYAKEPNAIMLLEQFLKKSKDNGISVILIHSPFYREGLEKIQNHDEMLSLFRSIAYKNNVPFLDYTKDPICYDTLNFYNAMHLNTHGADIFSAKLAHDLDSLGLIPARK